MQMLDYALGNKNKSSDTNISKINALVNSIPYTNPSKKENKSNQNNIKVIDSNIENNDIIVYNTDNTMNTIKKIFKNIYEIFAAVIDYPQYAISQQALASQLNTMEKYNTLLSTYKHSLPSNISANNSENKHLKWPPSNINNTEQNDTLNNELIYMVTNEREEVYNIVTNALLTINKQNPIELQWYEYIDKSLVNNYLLYPPIFNLLWTWKKPKLNYARLLSFQKVNHFPDSYHLTRKDLLKLHIQEIVDYNNKKKKKKSNKNSQDFFNIIPQTFILPKEHLLFLEHFTANSLKEKRNNYWILKPSNSSRGRGITLLNNIEHIDIKNSSYIVQKYIKNPLLINGYKFDLRLYVLLTSIKPLECFIYKQGFARFATKKYNLQSNDHYIHLTNTSIQNNNLKNINHDFPQDIMNGYSKISLIYLKKLLIKMNISFDDLWQKIIKIIIKSLVCIEDHMNSHISAFELFGYDILIDNNLQPWLIEINSSPDMKCLSTLDQDIKPKLIEDTIKIINPISYSRTKLHQLMKLIVKKNVNKNEIKQDELWNKLKNMIQYNQPRLYGELPTAITNFQLIAPSTFYTYAKKIKEKILNKNYIINRSNNKIPSLF